MFADSEDPDQTARMLILAQMCLQFSFKTFYPEFMTLFCSRNVFIIVTTKDMFHKEFRFDMNKKIINTFKKKKNNNNNNNNNSNNNNSTVTTV